MDNFYLESIKDSQKGYSDDPWVFLRELAQNSRDANATEIRIDPGGFGSDNEVVIFSDNGNGMTWKDAKKYFFRLYSSSKFKEKSSVGMYGIGFWTVMKFMPEEILVESFSREEEKWAVLLDKDLNNMKRECKLNRFGTRITLVRNKKFKDYNEFEANLKKGIQKYCRFVERKEERGEILSVFYRGKVVSGEMQYEEGISLKYGDRSFEGIVTLGDTPKVKLFTGGIPAWEGSTLNELSVTESSFAEKNNYIKNGIAPIFHINGRHLKVNMSRKEPIDDKALRKVIRKSEKALENLVQICSDHAYPRGRGKKIIFGIRKIFRKLSSSYWKIILLVLLLVLPLEIFMLNKFFTHEGEEKIFYPELVSSEGFRQYSATVGKIGKNVIADIEYSPAENVSLKMFTTVKYDKRSGFVWDGGAKNILPGPTTEYSGDMFKIKINLRNGGEIFLPYPSGYTILTGSLKIGRVKSPIMKRSSSGEVLIKIPGRNRSVEYLCTPKRKVSGEPEFNRKNYIYLPDWVKFPDEVETKIKRFFYLNMDNKIKTAIKLTNILVKYDTSDGTAIYFEKLRNHNNWLDKVLEIGAGDCDVVNGVLGVILRKSGVPTRLVIGLVGEKGRVLPQLHSWIEYYDDGWKEADATVFSVTGGENNPNEKLYFSELDKKSGDKKPERSDKLLLKLFFLLFLLSVFPFSLYYREWLIKEKEKREKLNPENKVKARRDIIEIGRSYLLNPEMWNYNFGILEQEIITTVKGKNISIKKSLDLLKVGKLFLGKQGNFLVDELKRSDEIIIDSGNIILYPIVRLFSGIIDLDMISELSPILPDKIEEGVAAEFIEAVNKILSGLTWKNVRCLNTPGLSGIKFKDVDLSVIAYRKFFRKTGYPKRFIALNMRAPEFLEFLTIFPKNRYLALFKFFRLITEESVFFQPDKDFSLKLILRSLLADG